MKIVIAGAGEVGHYVAKMLSSENHDIILMDSDEERLKDIPAAYDLLTLTGSPTSIHDLKEAGVPKADLFVAVTPHESVNMTACMLATNLGAKRPSRASITANICCPKTPIFSNAWASIRSSTPKCSPLKRLPMR